MADPINYCSMLLPSFCFTQSEWAAWAQAIMSALAIWYSGRLAFKQSRSSKRERIETYIELLAVACRASDIAVRITEEVVRSGGHLAGGRQDFAKLGASFHAIAFHEVPDYRLVANLRNASRMCEMLDEIYDRPAAEGTAFTLVDLGAIRMADRTLMEQRVEAEKISFELMSFGEHVVFSLWTIGTDISRRFKPQHRTAP